MYNYSLLFISTGLILLSCRQQSQTKPQRKTIIDAVFSSGHIENKNQYTVTANVEGYIESVYRSEGDTVLNSQSLFRLSNNIQEAQMTTAYTNLKYARSSTEQNSPQFEQLKIMIDQAHQKIRADSMNYERYTRLLKTQAVSTIDFENAQLTYQNSLLELKALHKNLDRLQNELNLNLENARGQYRVQQESDTYYVIKSTKPGIIMNLTKRIGDYVRKGDALALLAAGKPISKLYIAEGDIYRVKLGQTVLVSLNSDKNKIYEATITKIYPSFSASEQSFIAEATFKHSPNIILNGTQLQANIIVEKKQHALVIPSYYLIDENEVILAYKQEKRKVSTGIRTLEWTEITSGLIESDVLALPQ